MIIKENPRIAINVLNIVKVGKLLLKILKIKFYSFFSLNESECIDCKKNSNREKNTFNLKCECKKGYKEDSKG